ncbi:hypothetical protein [Corynebacterium parakroppenstedtii]|uniref:hypothetical protein n=1 Tax=Corynebacterium parakroppenstedtii TaxID=2828363 RepID=UPI0030EB371A
MLVLSDSCAVGHHWLNLLGHIIDLSETPGSFNIQVTRVERIGDGMAERYPTSILLDDIN